MTRWQSRFENSPRFQRISRIDEGGIRSKFLKETTKMSKRQTSLIVQLRSGHISLNLHLHRIHKSDTPHCPHCSLQGRQIPESVKHFILECPAYNIERFWLRGKVGRDANSLKALMAKEQTMKALIAYVDRTKRLRNIFGDAPPN
ncbi:hypothetical protein BT96DRAFT_835532 [Gymnopus androsaceus JB14]|uniref:Reverse transcriptase zinc-binding domain-containing protein n=1 Tax=Gymnopus androsaceus JB14 TaxID=1447944 RepID=A0A6A4GV56_9AGAR|nr:hypothetical protein BT96DRAFT_835532 [Gymnopus androsaceus JB14]